VGAGAIVLLASMFALDWYGLTSAVSLDSARLGFKTSVNGWDGLTNLRWLMLVTIACGLTLVFLQATRRSPALPAVFSVFVTVLAILTLLSLIYRVLINEPGPDSLVDQKAGAYVGLLSALALAYGGYLSMRREGIAPRDAPVEIEQVRLAGAGRS